MWWVNGCVQSALCAGEPQHTCRMLWQHTWCSCLVRDRKKSNCACQNLLFSQGARRKPPQACSPTPLLSSISLFSMRLHWSLSKLISVFPCPLAASLVPGLMTPGGWFSVSQSVGNSGKYRPEALKTRYVWVSTHMRHLSGRGSGRAVYLPGSTSPCLTRYCKILYTS